MNWIELILIVNELKYLIGFLFVEQVQYNERDVPKSPFEVKVEGMAGDASKVTASGPGIEADSVTVNRPTYFDVFTKDAGKGVPEVIVLDPAANRNTIPAKLRLISPVLLPFSLFHFYLLINIKFNVRIIVLLELMNLITFFKN